MVISFQFCQSRIPLSGERLSKDWPHWRIFSPGGSTYSHFKYFFKTQLSGVIETLQTFPFIVNEDTYHWQRRLAGPVVHPLSASIVSGINLSSTWEGFIQDAFRLVSQRKYQAATFNRVEPASPMELIAGSTVLHEFA